jgi:hypothetical protein
VRSVGVFGGDKTFPPAARHDKRLRHIVNPATWRSAPG